ncbi:MAG TPA: type VI secretion system baseplate subunit TssF [Bryobacteraceae bacterium]|nr:type VI secretion system baseplate subunit TssF [Bryobacteraceae bacterium]
MRDELLLYYERELNYLRQLGAEFGQKYPKIASRLILEPDKCDDPHVERLLEAFAFLAARVHLKIDDEFPEITEALLSILYPHYIRPLPSMSIVEMHLDAEQGGATAPQKVPRGAVLNSRPVAGVPCQFRTCFDTTVWPLRIAEGEWTSPDRLSPPVKSLEAAAAIRIEFRAPQDVLIPALNIDTLRIHIAGEANVGHTLYELLSANTVQILLRDPTPNSKFRPVTLRADNLRPAGFDEEESMLPYPRRSFPGYRLLQEYFTFPDKFFFFDLSGLRDAFAQGIKNRFELVFLLSQFEQTERRQILELGVSAKTFRINATPIVNLFGQTAEPILLDQRRYEYQVVPDVRRPMATEIFSIDEVVSIDPQSNDVQRFEPFYSFRHATQKDKRQTFWLAHRRKSARANDEGTEMSISLVDLSTRPVYPEVDTLTLRTTCTNRDLPARLSFANEAGDFELEGGAAVKRIVALRKPTVSVRPPSGKAALWRLISHLSLNYLSLVNEGREAFQEILKLYNFTGSAYSEKQIDGISALSSSRTFARLISENGITFARGTRVELELDEEMFTGGGVFLFASVIERFLGEYVSLNSFSQLSVRTRQRKEVVKEWPPRAGQTILM